MALSPDLVDDPMFMAVARLAECLCKELADAKGPSLCFCGLWVGTSQPPLGVAKCADGEGCGVAWVRLVGAFPSSSFPVPDDGLQQSSCATPLAYEVEIGVGRCAPRAEGREVLPSEQALFDAQRLYMSDMRAAKRALLCCLPEAQRKAEPGRQLVVSLGAYRPLDNAGGKSGGVWQGFIGAA